MFKKITLATLLIVTSATMASASCVKENVSGVNEAWVRSAPSLSGKALWKLTAGSAVIYCGNHEFDTRKDRIEWHWVTFKSDQEPWGHDGWISTRVLGPAIDAQSNTPSGPQSNAPSEPHFPPSMYATPTDGSWGDIVTFAERGKNSTNGHFCEPAERTCTMFISFDGANGETRGVRVVTSANGKILYRAVCQFNNLGDVRTCTDFDTKEQNVQMKDIDGKWIAIN